MSIYLTRTKHGAIDEIFLSASASLGLLTTGLWSGYFHLQNMVSEFVANNPDKIIDLLENKDFAVAMVLMGYIRAEVLQPLLLASMAVCGISLVWLIWSASLFGLDNSQFFVVVD